ncbi:MAG: sel1 repeat family protein, partial [Proteobacteria bacterium]|nr:sel1 repeat family protein [Pseudomonadota bacterium]
MFNKILIVIIIVSGIAAYWYYSNNIGNNFERGMVHYENKNYTKAIQLFEKDSDNAKAQYQLGMMYYNGIGVNKNLVKASSWYHKAAARNIADAQNTLGIMYKNGEGVVQNLERAELWFLDAISRGHVNAQANLGEL